MPFRDATILSVGRARDVPTCRRIASGFTLFDRVFVIDSSRTNVRGKRFRRAANHVLPECGILRTTTRVVLGVTT